MKLLSTFSTLCARVFLLNTSQAEREGEGEREGAHSGLNHFRFWVRCFNIENFKNTQRARPSIYPAHKVAPFLSPSLAQLPLCPPDNIYSAK